MEQSDGLETGANLEFQQLWWRVESILYVVITVLVLAGALGLMGRGPLSLARRGDVASGLSVDYERFARFRTPTMMTVHLGPRAVHDGRVSLRLTGTVNERIMISRVVPQPESAAPVPDGQLYTFAVPTAGDSASIRFVMEPGRVGRSEARLSAGDATPLSLSQFVYP